MGKRKGLFLFPTPPQNVPRAALLLAKFLARYIHRVWQAGACRMTKQEVVMSNNKVLDLMVDGEMQSSEMNSCGEYEFLVDILENCTVDGEPVQDVRYGF